MPRARIHKDNAARQAAYRERKRAGLQRAGFDMLASVSTPGTEALVQRVKAEDERLRQRDAER